MKLYKRNIFVLMLLLCLAGRGFAQFQINPQFGFNITKTTPEPDLNIKTLGSYGFSIGCDFKLGGRFYFLPGVFITSAHTTYQQIDSMMLVSESVVDRYAIGLRGWLGFKLVNMENFKIRITTGPSYDFFLVTDDHDNVKFSKDYFNNGSFNLDAGFGFDLWRISLDLSYSFGLSSSFNKDFLSDKPKYQRLSATIGFIIGKRSRK